MVRIVRDDMRYVSSITGLPVPHRFPKVKFGTREELTAIIVNDYPEANADVLLTIEAVYHDRTIHLHHTWEAGNKEHWAILLHELTHYQQDQNGHEMGPDCEYDAYKVEAEYLKLNGYTIHGEWDANIAKVNDILYPRSCGEENKSSVTP